MAVYNNFRAHLERANPNAARQLHVHVMTQALALGMRIVRAAGGFRAVSCVPNMQCASGNDWMRRTAAAVARLIPLIEWAMAMALQQMFPQLYCRGEGGKRRVGG